MRIIINFTMSFSYKESTSWRAQVRLRIIRSGLSIRWQLPLKLWWEWNGCCNEETIGLTDSTIFSTLVHFNHSCQSVYVAITIHYIWREVYSFNVSLSTLVLVTHKVNTFKKFKLEVKVILSQIHTQNAVKNCWILQVKAANYTVPSACKLYLFWQ